MVITETGLIFIIQIEEIYFIDRSIPGVYFLNRDTYELKHVIYSGAFSSGRKIFIDKFRLYTNNLYRGVVRKVTDFADRHYIKQVSGIF